MLRGPGPVRMRRRIFVVSEVEHDDVALEIRGDESDRRAAETCSERARLDRERNGNGTSLPRGTHAGP